MDYTLIAIIFVQIGIIWRLTERVFDASTPETVIEALKPVVFPSATSVTAVPEETNSGYPVDNREELEFEWPDVAFPPGENTYPTQPHPGFLDPTYPNLAGEMFDEQ